MFRPTALALLALAAVAAAPAWAEPQTLSRAVSYADLNLTSPAGVRALRRRAFGAVVAICGDAISSDIDAMSDMLACRRAAMKQARAETLAAAAQKQRLAARDVGLTRVAVR